MADHTAEAVSLPPASIDFNALNDALHAGETGEAALEKALVPGTLALSAEEAAAQAAASVAAAPSLARLNKAELLAIGEAERVTDALDKDGHLIAFADASNPRMVEAIEAKRKGELLPRVFRDGEIATPGTRIEPAPGVQPARDL